MKRFKRRVKEEKPETSTAPKEEHDLAYYIHDRVELMHQVFSVLKPKELKIMAPESIRDISIDDLQELCTEELLGISSKRLCAILDGAEPPSDTESSSASPERLETISLDSISSDEEILSQSSKKKKKHKRHSKARKKDKKPASPAATEQGSRAARAGLTVLELLELQARARAIRAQLHQEQAKLASTSAPAQQARVSDDDDEAVLIKEEPTLVVEISSDEDKPNVAQLEASLKKTTSNEPSGQNPKSPPKQNNVTQSTTTKVVNNLVITMPKPQNRRRIKLNRNKRAPENNSIVTSENSKSAESTSAATNVGTEIENKNDNDCNNKKQEVHFKTNETVKKAKKVKKKKQKERDGSDHDEITLQLSDSEKIDLLEHFDGKKANKEWPAYYSSSEDSDSSSSESSGTSNEADESKDVIDKAEQQNRDASNKIVEQNNDNAVKDCTAVNVTNDSSAVKNQSQVNKDCTSSVKDQPSATASIVLEEVKVEISNIDLGGSPANEFKSADKTVEEIETGIETNLSLSEGNSNTNNKGQHIVNSSHEVSEPMEVDESPIQSEANIEITSFTTDIPILEDVATSKEQNADDQNKKNNETQLDKQSSDLEVINMQKNSDRIIVQGNNRSVETKELDAPLKSTVNVVTNDPRKNEMDASLKSNVNVVLNERKSKESETLIKSAVNVVSNEANVTKSSPDDKTRSDGEVSDAESSEIEAVDLRPDVVCISDEDTNKTKKKKKDKSKKKEKKVKKDKKKKSKSDFRKDGDQNFFTQKLAVIEIVDQTELNYKAKEDCEIEDIPKVLKSSDKPKSLADSDSEQSSPITIDDDDIYEILELSDDSSCYEVEGVSLLSKEPTTDEIAAFSARIDEEFEKDNAVNDVENANNVTEKDKDKDTNDLDEIVKISWKDRYLGSKKVKQVLTTSNILNAMRKKNIELKKKIEQSKRELELQKQQEIERQREKEREEQAEKERLEGTIEHYNTLVGSTKYVDPVPDKMIENKDDLEPTDKNIDGAKQSGEVTRAMKKDAKQLLKMYKRLLKYNDMSIEKCHKKKKKKKNKKSKEKPNIVASSVLSNDN